ILSAQYPISLSAFIACFDYDKGMKKQQHLKPESGQNIVEFALIVSVAILLLFAIIDLGRVVSIHTVMGGAAQAAARQGAVQAQTNVDSFARDRMTSFDSSSVEVVVAQTDDYTEVTLGYQFEPITPFVRGAIGQENLMVSTTARVYKLGSAYVAKLGLGENNPGVTATPGGVETSQPENTPEPPAATPTSLLPTATDTPIPVIATSVSPTATQTPIPPTATSLPPSATPIPPTATPVPPTATPELPTPTPTPIPGVDPCPYHWVICWVLGW
ncbi:MAG TPA: TadE/TadG family type IV pilus assembly protein, partial [Caldilineaceae bacterium]|nr:TadE/TadG family type IV pilus assembly protein [Caldilineaceae bacterium]